MSSNALEPVPARDLSGESSLDLASDALWNHDFCPWANPYVDWLKSPLAQLALSAVASLAIGICVAPQGYVAFVGLLAVILLGMAWPWIAISGVRASFRFERSRATEGDVAPAVLVVENHWPWPVWGLLLQDGFAAGAIDSRDGQEAAPVELALACVPGWSQVEFRWNFSPDCRGEYPRAIPRLTTEFPCGLWRAGREVEVTGRLLVRPLVLNLAPIPLRKGARWSFGAHSPLRAGQEGEVLGTRPFREGDSMRHVHWPQTARCDRLIVSERQATLAAEVAIEVEGGEIQAGAGPSGTLEWLVRVVASVAHMCLCNGYEPRLVGATGEVIRTGRSWEEWGDALARWMPALAVPTRSRPPRGPAPFRIRVTTRSETGGDPATTRADLTIRLDAATWTSRPTREEFRRDHESPTLAIRHAASAAAELRSGWERSVRRAAS